MKDTRMKNYSWIQILFYIVAALIPFAIVGWYHYYTWSDCLGENSLLTCMRMLNR